jgi:3-deoxy-D-manno-octulosonate 8-phosphate phosphatase (KDO 8-P phosphatase)
MVKSKKLSKMEFSRRAHDIRLVLTDNDGVLTDTGVYYNEHGEAFKRFSIRDGMGVELLQKQGIETAIITSEISASVRRRAEKLKMPRLYLGIKGKEDHLPLILRDTGLQLSNIAYIGDDVNDLGIIRVIAREGLTAAPSDAIETIRHEVHYICKARGGNGAFRDFADQIINHTTTQRSRAKKGRAK